MPGLVRTLGAQSLRNWLSALQSSLSPVMSFLSNAATCSGVAFLINSINGDKS
ncbi:TPA: hypothetical protein JAJ34_002990 [Legionella pneumophila]|nr:hypothetical protein [Legionella pneumophila]